MPTPSFLGLDHVIRLHRSLIEHYGGTGGQQGLANGAAFVAAALKCSHINHL